MRIRVILSLALLVASTTLVNAHDLFIKLDSYFLQPHSAATIPILNGSFVLSENAIMRDRVIDISMVSSNGRVHIDTTQWLGDTTYADTTFLTVETGAPGTYIVGASTRPRDLRLAAADFNDYLEHDGIPDVLEARRQDNELDKDVWERYSKHVKAVLQVGDRRDAFYLTPLGYPAEIVPLVNPYDLHAGDEISVLCLLKGQPVANQLVILGGEQGGNLVGEMRKRTDRSGVVGFAIESPGKWYVEFINMQPSAAQDIDYESNWATLAFEIR
ncbi:MAG: DUF4198 domain-containing protein [Gemmatimonadota bacterium]|nr:MAG: DUF4198 domain-containing protein [Gemmatimonadota bacterium]